MKFKLLYTFVLLFTISISTVSSQNKKQQPLKVINYGENINDPLTQKELSFIKEAYGENAQEYVLNIPQRVKDVKHILRNRVYIEEYKNKDLSSIKLLSSVPLNNKSLKTDNSFNPNTFNGLNYSFDFYSRSKEIITFRVDNTSYLISVKPQHQ